LICLADLLLSHAERRDESWIEPTHYAFVEGIAIYFDVPEGEFGTWETGHKSQPSAVH
jgi:hypothetical protein